MAKLTKTKRSQLIRDLITSQRDLLETAEQYRMSPDDLATWINEPENARCLHGVCLLADLQTQLMLSRYRMLAASRLIRLATEEGSGDVARRACVDLLRSDLKRAEPRDSASDSAASDSQEQRELMALTAMLAESSTLENSAHE